MRVIHKFGPYNPHEIFTIEDVHTLVHFDVQDGGLFLWCERDKENLRKREATFLIVGTGWDYEPVFEHRQSLIQGPYVWHLLEITDPWERMAKLF